MHERFGEAIYTIGHSTHPIEAFIDIAHKNALTTIVDVRSAPYSSFVPQYNKETLCHALKSHKIDYLYMGDLLGARYDDKKVLFEDGKVNFKKVQKTKDFQKGILRLEHGLGKGYRIALMCSEKEAFDCHRFGLISEYLTHHKIRVEHIYPDALKSQATLEQRLLKKYEHKLPQGDLFTPSIHTAKRLAYAYELRNKDIAYNAFLQDTNASSFLHVK